MWRQENQPEQTKHEEKLASQIRQIYKGTLFSLQLVSNLWCDTWRCMTITVPKTFHALVLAFIDLGLKQFEIVIF